MFDSEDKDSSNLLQTVAAIESGLKPQINLESGLSGFVDMVLQAKIGDREKHVILDYVYSRNVKTPSQPATIRKGTSPTTTKKPQGSPNKKSPVAREPGVSRSVAFKVEEKDRDILRQILQLGEGVPIPRWAITGFGYYRDLFIRDLKAKKVSGDNFNRWFSQQRKLELKKVPQSQIESEWVALKKKFSNVPLLRRPRSGKEKEFRSAFDKFCKTYPSWKSRPKLVEQQIKDPSNSPKKTVVSNQLEGLGNLSELVRLLQPLRELASMFLISK